MLSALLKQLTLPPRIYDVVQRVFGERHVQARLAPHMNAVHAGARLIDIGGGTGPRILPGAPVVYVCADIDVKRLRRVRLRTPDSLALAADATRCPIKSDTIDVVLCSNMTHHLGDEQLHAMLSEASRIVRTGGTFIVIDATSSTRMMTRLLWRLDRGSHPRPATVMKRAVSEAFEIVHWEQFRAGQFHDFFLCVARK